MTRNSWMSSRNQLQHWHLLAYNQGHHPPNILKLTVLRRKIIPPVWIFGCIVSWKVHVILLVYFDGTMPRASPRMTLKTRRLYQLCQILWTLSNCPMILCHLVHTLIKVLFSWTIGTGTVGLRSLSKTSRA